MFPPRDEPVETIALAEEALRVGKREVTSGRVRVRSLTETVEEMARATLDEEKVDIERMPIGREVDTPPGVCGPRTASLSSP